MITVLQTHIVKFSSLRKYNGGRGGCLQESNKDKSFSEPRRGETKRENSIKISTAMRYSGKKKKAWDSLRFYVYERDAIKYNGKCFTCNVFPESYNRQAGHCFPVGFVGSNNKLSWDERQIRVQCGRCNGPGLGMQAVFKDRLVRELGTKIYNEMEKRQSKVDPINNWDEVIHKFQTKLIDLRKGGDIIVT